MESVGSVGSVGAASWEKGAASFGPLFGSFRPSHGAVADVAIANPQQRRKARPYTRRISRSSTTSTTAPTVATMMVPSVPPPADTPSALNR